MFSIYKDGKSLAVIECDHIKFDFVGRHLVLIFERGDKEGYYEQNDNEDCPYIHWYEKGHFRRVRNLEEKKSRE